MLPWGHLGVAYLCFTAVVRTRYGRAPSGAPTLALVVASQTPDLIDKPLGWSLDVLPGGRTLGHSIVAGGVVALAGIWVARRGHEELALGVLVGYLGHLVLDLPWDLPLGNLQDARFLLWPALEVPEDYPDPEGVITYLSASVTDASSILQFGVLAVAVWVWRRDGSPGVETVRVGWRRLLARVPG